MIDPVEEGARAAAKRLAPQYGPGLASDVEAALRTRYLPAPSDQYVDPISIGILVVAIATLAWTVVNDLKDKRRSPEPEIITRTVQAQLRETRDLDTAHHEQIIIITIQETLKATLRDQAD